MKRSDAFPSRYLGKDDLQNADGKTFKTMVGTIAAVRMETIKGEHGDEDKAIMSFSGELKPLICNNTNWIVCEEAYGPDSDFWEGKKVEIYVDPNVMFGTKRVGGVRLRALKNGTPAKEESFDDVADAWSFDKACHQCGQVGINKDDIKNRLKLLGYNGWNPARDTPTVQKWIAAIQSQVPAGDEIPFSFLLPIGLAMLSMASLLT